MKGLDVANGAAPSRAQDTVVRRFVALLAGWTALTMAASLLLPGSPRESWFVLTVIGALIAPPVVFLIVYRAHQPFRATVHALDLSVLTTLELGRIAGIAMLALWAAGALTPVFALWAGGIDVFIGFTAVPVAFLVANRRPVPRWPLRLWHCLGLLDFVVAVPLGLLYSPSRLGAWLVDGHPSTYPMFAFPLSFIPMVGVPVMITVHLAALLQLRGAREPVSGPILHPRSA